MHPEINRIRSKNSADHWPQYVESVTISNLHGWSGEQIQFSFPFMVICGENGTGKSTILKATAACHKHPTNRSLSFTAGKFFPDTTWESIVGGKIVSEIRTGQTRRTVSISKPTQRWRPSENRPPRNVFLFDISRTLPKEGVVGYAQIAKKNTTEVSTIDLSDEVRTYYSAIMGRRYTVARHASTDAAPERQVGVVDNPSGTYSQFHQGAGESCSLDLLAALQNVPNYSLILIDEIEASLHPSAQRRLVHFLLWLCRTKKCQIICTTHSPYILEELPPEARILLVNTNTGLRTVQGASKNYALGRMDTTYHPDLYIFVEDEESKVLVTEILRRCNVDISSISITPIGPYSAVNAIAQIASEGHLGYVAIGVIDGDADPTNNCYKLPGGVCPEQLLFSSMAINVDALATRLNIDSGGLSNALSQTMTTEADHHKWIPVLASRLRVPNDYLWTTIVKLWVDTDFDPDSVSELIDSVNNTLVL